MCQRFRSGFFYGQGSYLHTAWLWDGILLWANDIHLTRLTYPVTLFDEDAYLLLNICHSGRCELELSPGSFVYMSPGILNVSMNPPKSKYYYPGGIYKGIELCFDLRKMREQMQEALTSYGFDLSMLERFAGKGNVLAMMKSESVQEEEKLFDMLCEGKSSIYSIRFAILSLLHHLVNGGAEEFDSRTLVTKGQRRKLRKLCGLWIRGSQGKGRMPELHSRSRNAQYGGNVGSGEAVDAAFKAACMRVYASISKK